MKIRTAFAIVAVTLLGLLGREASACGYCVEDKIASTYDHSVVTRALSQGHHVAFFHIDGPVSSGEADSASHRGRGLFRPGGGQSQRADFA